MSVGGRIGLTTLLFVVGAVGLGLLRELYGHGMHNVIWGTLIAVAMVWIWTLKVSAPSVASDLSAPPEQVILSGPKSQTAGPARQDQPGTHAVPGQTGEHLNAGTRWRRAAPLIIGVVAVGLIPISALLLDAASKTTLRCEGTGTTAGTINVLITPGWFTKPTITLNFDESFLTFDIVESSSARYRAKADAKLHPQYAEDTLDIDRFIGSLTWLSSPLQEVKDYTVDCLLSPTAHCFRKGSDPTKEYAYTCRVAVPSF